MDRQEERAIRRAIEATGAAMPRGDTSAIRHFVEKLRENGYQIVPTAETAARIEGADGVERPKEK
jgi:hypothetical protein